LAAAPVGLSDKYTVLAGEMLVNEPGVLANDHDADGDALTAVLVGAPRFGAVALAPDGGFRYLPSRNFRGEAASVICRVATSVAKILSTTARMRLTANRPP
jgi:hypothetical protein